MITHSKRPQADNSDGKSNSHLQQACASIYSATCSSVVQYFFPLTFFLLPFFKSTNAEQIKIRAAVFSCLAATMSRCLQASNTQASQPLKSAPWKTESVALCQEQLHILTGCSSGGVEWLRQRGKRRHAGKKNQPQWCWDFKVAAFVWLFFSEVYLRIRFVLCNVHSPQNWGFFFSWVAFKVMVFEKESLIRNKMIRPRKFGFIIILFFMHFMCIYMHIYINLDLITLFSDNNAYLKWHYAGSCVKM